MRSKTGEDRKCLICGTVFYVPNHALKKRRCCSKKCDYKLRSIEPRKPKSQTELKCKKCGNLFFVAEHRASVAKFCSKKCHYDAMNTGAIKNVITMPCHYCGQKIERYYTPGKLPKKPKCQNCIEGAKSPFRFLLVRAKISAKSRGLDFNLTLDHLKDVWSKQKGLCVYSNILLKLGNQDAVKLCGDFEQASLDRIDSDIGYIEGNVQFVSKPVNWLKHQISDEKIRQFFDTYYNTRRYIEGHYSDCDIVSFTHNF